MTDTAFTVRWVQEPPPEHIVYERDHKGRVTRKVVGGKIVPFKGG